MAESPSEYALLLEASCKKHYLVAYQNFLQWHNFNGIEANNFSKNILLRYFYELSRMYPRQTVIRIYGIGKYCDSG